MEPKFTLRGFDESKKFLDRFPDRVQKRVLQTTVMAGARVTAKYIKANAPRDKEGQSASSKKYGRLFKNIRVIRLKKVKPGSKAARVDTGNSFWGFFLQKGTRFIPANPWFSSAFEASVPAALEKMADTMANRIPIEAEKLASEMGSVSR